MYIHRAMEDIIVKISDTFPALLLTGPRQVEKTTLLTHLEEEGRRYITLDDLDIRMMEKTIPLCLCRGIHHR